MCGPCAGGGGGRQDGSLRGPAADDQEALAQSGEDARRPGGPHPGAPHRALGAHFCSYISLSIRNVLE